MKTFDELVVNDHEVTLDGERCKAVFGKHCIWLPDRGMKIIWSYQGRIESFKDWDKGKNRASVIDGSFNRDNKGFSFNFNNYRKFFENRIMKITAV